WAVGHAVDHQAAGAADAFTAVAFKGDGLLALADQLFVELVEHFEEGHLRHDVVDGVLLETPGLIGASLSPDFQVKFHRRSPFPASRCATLPGRRSGSFVLAETPAAVT